MWTREPTDGGRATEGPSGSIALTTTRFEHVNGPLSEYDVVHDEIQIGPLRLPVARPRSAEELIDEDDYARDERLPYWAELWPSALVLAERLTGRDLAGRRVVEVGCGVGVPAVVAALLGARTLATDWYAPALAFARANAEASGARVETLLVDWADPPPALLGRPPADLVIGADVLYEERNGPALAALLPRLVAPGGEALIADPRRPHADALLDPLRAAGWAHSCEEARYRGRPDESGPVIRLHRLTPPA
jgi:predicted nicotinamide N-methyase